ncbi:hypothetical protein ACFL4N_01760 [Thermodesulfobacteriota bacterium]
MKIAVFRKSRTSLEFYRAAAHWRTLYFPMVNDNTINTDLKSALAYLHWQYFWIFMSGLVLLALDIYFFLFAELQYKISSQFSLFFWKYVFVGIVLAFAHMTVLVFRLPRNVAMYAFRWKCGKSISEIFRYLKSFCTLHEIGKGLLYWAVGIGIVAVSIKQQQWLLVLIATGPAFCITASLIWFAYRLKQRRREKET